MSLPFLKTAHLDLRPLELSDADGPYLQWFNDPEVCRSNSHFVFPYRREDAIAYIQALNGSRTDLVLAIVERDANRHIGNIALTGMDPIHRSAEFSIVIGEKECWGKGYSKEAGGALVDHGFRALNLNRIHCGTFVDNAAMRKLAEFLGMREEGIRRSALFKNGRYLDVVLYGVLQHEYVTRNHA